MRDKIIDSVGIVLSGTFTVIQTNETLQIISLVLTIISVLIVTSFNIYKWYKTATSDGKITASEINDLSKIVDDTANKIENIKEDK